MLLADANNSNQLSFGLLSFCETQSVATILLFIIISSEPLFYHQNLKPVTTFQDYIGVTGP